MNAIVSLLVLGTLLFFFYVRGSVLARRTGFRFSDYRRFGAYPGSIGGLIGGATGLVFAVCAVGSGWGPVITVAAILEAVLLGFVVESLIDGLVRLVVALTRNDSR
jgi:hypothetical protein